MYPALNFVAYRAVNKFEIRLAAGGAGNYGSRIALKPLQDVYPLPH